MSLPQPQSRGAHPPLIHPKPVRRSRLRVVGEALLVVAITLVMIAILLEVGLRLFAPQLGPEMQSEELRGLYVADPATVYRNAPNAHITFRLPDSTSTIETDAQGLREASKIGPVQPNTTRLLCLGDSFTFGWAVQGDQAYPELLNGGRAADGTAVESVNAGVNGYGTDNEAAWLDTYGWALQPKIILVGFFVGNDVRDDILGMNKTEINSQGDLVPTDPNEIPESATPLTTSGGAIGPIKDWLARNSQAYVLLRRIANDIFAPKKQPAVRQPNPYDTAPIYYSEEPADLQAGWEKATQLLEKMRASASAHGATLVVVAIPTREQVEDNYWQDMKQGFGLSDLQLNRDLPQTKLAQWSARAGAPLIDLLPGFRADGKDKALYYNQDPHWNPAGHALAAQLIRQGMVKLGLFSP